MIHHMHTPHADYTGCWQATPTRTGTSLRLVGVPFCPDLLEYANLGAADTLRGRVIRVIFWTLQWWRP